MRADMAKVIVERPRLNGHAIVKGENRRMNRIGLENLERRESIRARWTRNLGYDRKELNENLNPLERFLATRVGQLWDKVYSEICERINRNSPVQLHIWQHIWDFVERDVIMVDGLPRLNRCHYSFLKSEDWGSIYSPFYIHPVTGLLLKNESYREKKYRQEKNVSPYTVVDGHYYRTLDGIWYEVTLTPLREKKRDPRMSWSMMGVIASPEAYDYCLRKPVLSLGVGDLVEFHGRIDGKIVYASHKRQLGKREIRRLISRTK